MKINTKFDINQKVYINQLKTFGKITGIYLNSSGAEFNVRYFAEMTPTTCYFSEDDLSLDSPEGLGFKV